jgi:hypothetical protein
MFWKRKKVVDKPLGVQLKIELNLSTLDKVAKTSNPPNTENMSNTWVEYHCVTASFGIAAINSVKDSILFYSGSDSCIYRDLDFEIKLPYQIGSKYTDLIKITPTEDFIFLSFDEVAIMAFPTPYIINSLMGKLLVDYRNVLKNEFGDKSEIDIKVTSLTGGYNLPIISTVAANWFVYENTAVKVMATLIANNDDFPINLGLNTN